MFKRICPYCGGRCKVSGGADGNPYHQHYPQQVICINCGRSVPMFSNDIQLQETKSNLENFLPVVDEILMLTSKKLKITAVAQASGVERSAEVLIPLQEGTHSLEGDYPFGRIDIDAKPKFQLQSVEIMDDTLHIAGETVNIDELPKTITKKLTAYGYGHVPWEELIYITISKNEI